MPHAALTTLDRAVGTRGASPVTQLQASAWNDIGVALSREAK